MTSPAIAPNSLFFQVIEPPPLTNVGWEVRVLDYSDFTSVVAVVPDFTSLSVSPQLSDPGAGSITVDLDSPFWSTTLVNHRPARDLLDYEYLWEAWEDGSLRFQWLGRNITENVVDDNESHVVTISGPGAAEIIRYAVTLPPGYPVVPAAFNLETAVSSSNDVPALGWEFPPNWPAMRMWFSLFEAAQSRHTIRWVKPLFTATHDSGGEEWDYVPTTATVAGQGFRPTAGQDLLAFLADATGQQASKQFAAYAEWVMWPGGYLDVRAAIGTRRDQEVIFFEGGLRSKHRTRSREDIANYVVVTDIYGGTSLAVDRGSQSQWNQREKLDNHNANITDAGRRNAIAQLILNQEKTEKSQWTIQVPYDEPGRRPFVDYDLGDWIGVSTYQAGLASTVDAFRVKAILISVKGDQTVVELTLQSLFDLRQRSLESLLTQVVNQVGNSSLGTLPDVNIPIAPQAGDVLGFNGKQWTNLTPTSTEPPTPSASAPLGLLGVMTTNNGAVATASSTTIVAVASADWDYEPIFTFASGRIFKVTVGGGTATAGGTAMQGAVQLRKGAETASGLLLLAWLDGIPAGFNNLVLSRTFTGYIKNTSGLEVSTKLSLCASRITAASTYVLYGDNTYPLWVIVEDWGLVADQPGAALFAVSV